MHKTGRRVSGPWLCSSQRSEGEGVAVPLGSPETSTISLELGLQYSALSAQAWSLWLGRNPSNDVRCIAYIPRGALKGASHNSHLVNEASVMCQSSIPLLSLGCPLGHGPPPSSLETEGSWGSTVRQGLSVASLGEQGCCVTSQLSPQRTFYHPTRHTAPGLCLESSELCPQWHEGRKTSKDANWSIECYIQEKQGGSMTPSSREKSSNT